MTDGEFGKVGESTDGSSLMDVFLNVTSVLLDLVKVICLTVPILLQEIFRAFFRRTPKNCAGQTVLVTGGANGLGKGLAQEFASRGCSVIVVDLDLAAAERTCAELRRQHQVPVYAYRVDVSSYDQVAALAVDVQKTIGPVDILVNNAALVYFNFLENTSVEDASRTIDINVKSHIWITGGANGLGREIALQLASRGCNVIIVDLDLKAAESTCADLRRRNNVQAYAYRVDVSSYEELESMASTIAGIIGPVDLLVNNAGLIPFKFLQDSSAADIHRVIDVNVKSYIWITGGANGLGREIASQLARRGCNVIIADVDLKAAESTCADLRRKNNIEAYSFRVDVSSYEEVQNLAGTIHKDLGPVDLLVNNAGVIHISFLQDSSVADIHRVIDVNLKSYIWTTKIFLEKMMERKQGHIVAISSMSGMYAFPWAVVYSASKYAVNGFMAAVTEQLRLQGFSEHIQTTCVCPYYIATRKDIVDFLKKPRFKLLSTERTARVIVEGILRNESTIAIPPFFDLGVKFMQLFPLKVQQLVRDYIIREYELNSS